MADLAAELGGDLRVRVQQLSRQYQDVVEADQAGLAPPIGLVDRERYEHLEDPTEGSLQRGPPDLPHAVSARSRITGLAEIGIARAAANDLDHRRCLARLTQTICVGAERVSQPGVRFRVGGDADKLVQQREVMAPVHETGQ